jgi:hypothetical protein
MGDQRNVHGFWPRDNWQTRIAEQGPNRSDFFQQVDHKGGLIAGDLDTQKSRTIRMTYDTDTLVVPAVVFDSRTLHDLGAVYVGRRDFLVVMTVLGSVGLLNSRDATKHESRGDRSF